LNIQSQFYVTVASALPPVKKMKLDMCVEQWTVMTFLVAQGEGLIFIWKQLQKVYADMKW